jgi:hypothetical protein
VQTASARLQLRNASADPKDRLLWKWTHGAATTRADFGDPTTTTAYDLCAYDGAGALVASFAAPAAGTCRERACWKGNRAGFRYVDKDLSPTGLRQIVLKAGAAGKAQIVVKGQGGALGLPALPLSHLPVTVQLVSTDAACFEARYTTTLRNGTERFDARGD